MEVEDKNKKEANPAKTCGAQLRGKPGQYCKRHPIKGRRRCRLHGGKTPRGKESPHWKTGEFSIEAKPTPPSPELIQHALNGDYRPELERLRQDVALVDAMLMDAMQYYDIENEASKKKNLKPVAQWPGKNETETCTTTGSAGKAIG